MTTTSARHRMKPDDLVHREWYLQRLDWHLRNLPGKQRKQIKRDLRTEVSASAAEDGIRTTLHDLGKPATLAERYTDELDHEGPRYVSGGIAAALAGSALLYFLGAYAVGALDTLDAVGGGTRTAHLFGSKVVFTATSQQYSVEISNALPLTLVVIAVSSIAFLLVARIWRLRHR